MQPADENGLYKLFFQKEDRASVIHYSLDTEGVLQKSVENTDFVSADGYDSTTNHWLIVHLTPEESESESETADVSQTSQTSVESDQNSSESLEGKVDDEPKVTSTEASQDVAKVPESTKAPETKPATTSPAPSTTSPTTTPTTAHTHTWDAVTTTVHHDAITSQVWKEDSAAWDETVVTKAAWDEQVLSQAAYDEQVLVSAAYDEPVYEWVAVCNVCGYEYPKDATDDDYGYHALISPGDGGGWHDIQIQTGSTYHDAVYNIVHHDAVYTTVHHDAETTVVHHDATGHYETVVTQAAWDETVTTGYKCSTCGATK